MIRIEPDCPLEPDPGHAGGGNAGCGELKSEEPAPDRRGNLAETT